MQRVIPNSGLGVIGYIVCIKGKGSYYKCYTMQFMNKEVLPTMQTLCQEVE